MPSLRAGGFHICSMGGLLGLSHSRTLFRVAHLHSGGMSYPGGLGFRVLKNICLPFSCVLLVD